MTTPYVQTMHYVKLEDINRLAPGAEGYHRAVCEFNGGSARLVYSIKYVERVTCPRCLRWLIAKFSENIGQDRAVHYAHWNQTYIDPSVEPTGSGTAVVVCAAAADIVSTKWVEYVTCPACVRWLADFFVGRLAAAERDDWSVS